MKKIQLYFYDIDWLEAMKAMEEESYESGKVKILASDSFKAYIFANFSDICKQLIDKANSLADEYEEAFPEETLLVKFILYALCEQIKYAIEIGIKGLKTDPESEIIFQIVMKTLYDTYRNYKYILHLLEL